MGTYCAVDKCSNHQYVLLKWEKEECQTHVGFKHSACPCREPFK